MVGLVRAHYNDSVGSDNFVQREAHGLLKIDLLFVLNVLNEVDEDLGVGIAREGVAFGCEQLFELGIVLDDSVVDNDKSSGIGCVRVRIAVRRLAVGSPAGVSDTQRGVRALCIGERFECRNFTYFFKYL